jgi:transcriptional regulator with GAF, ATPase, and Fis domain
VIQKREFKQSRQAGLDAIVKLTSVIDDHDRLEENYTDILNVIKDTLNADRVALLLADSQGIFRFQSSLGLSKKYQAAVDGHSPWTPFTPKPETI